MNHDYQILDKNSEKYRKALDDEFFKEFPELKAFLDNMSFYGNSETQQITAGGASLSSDNHKYQGTPYFYKKERNADLEFIHFTNFHALLSILHSNTLRFSSLNDVNDPNEIAFASEIFQLDADHIERHKKSILSFSLCEFHSEDEEIGTNANNLDLWRFYGGNGNGVAIKLKILNDPKCWQAYHLSDIKYGTKPLEYWRSVKSGLDKFNSKYPQLYVNLAQLLSFHKNKFYKNEQEVRLIFGVYYDKNSDFLNFPSSTSGKESYPKVEKKDNRFFSYLPLASSKQSEAQEWYFERSPQITLEQVYLGSKFKEEELPIYRSIINNLLKESAGVALPDDKIIISELNKHYR